METAGALLAKASARKEPCAILMLDLTASSSSTT
jgi:hypothetical protein